MPNKRDRSKSALPDEGSLPFTADSKQTVKMLRQDHSIATLIKTKKAVQIANNGGLPPSPSNQTKSHQDVHSRINNGHHHETKHHTVKFSSAQDEGASTSRPSISAGSGGESGSPADGDEDGNKTRKPHTIRRGRGVRDSAKLVGKQGSGAQRKRAAITLAPEKFSFIEEGKNMRAGRKPTVNCWTVITVNGKEFVVEKEFKAAGGTQEEAAPAPYHVVGDGKAQKADFNPLRQGAGKVRCDLCLLFFMKDSVSGVISFKRILDLRRKWGLELCGRRNTAASYIYSEARLCLFCSQLFHVSDRGTCDDSKQKPPVEGAERMHFDAKTSANAGAEGMKKMTPPGMEASRTAGSKGNGAAGNKVDMPDRDVAKGKPVVTSSVADGCPGKVVVSGLWKTRPNVQDCCKTFTEFDPWLEIDLLALYFLRSIRILHRVDPRGAPRVYRMTPFWVLLSKTPILGQDLHDARKTSHYAIKVVKDEKISTIEIPMLTGTTRYVRIQVEGARPLQLAGVQVLKGDMPPAVAPAARSPTREKKGPGGGLALLFANVKQRTAAATGGGNGGESNQLFHAPPASAPLVRPHTTGGSLSLSVSSSSQSSTSFAYVEPGGHYTPDMESEASICSLMEHHERPAVRPSTTSTFFTRAMAGFRVDDLMVKTLKGYKQKEEFEFRLSCAKAPFLEVELQPLTELFLSVAYEAGYPRTTPLEFMKIQTASIIASLASLRTRNTTMKELLGEGSSLEAMLEAIDNVCRLRQAKGGKPVKTLPADYPQYLELITCLRQGKVTLTEVSRIFASFINKGIMRDPLDSKGWLVRPPASKVGADDLILISKDQRKLYQGIQCYLKQRQGFLKRYEKKGAGEDRIGVEWVDWVKIHDERREHQEQLRLAAAPPTITPRLPHKACAVCLHHFPGDALIESVTVKSLANLFTRLNLPPDKYTTRLEFGMNKFYRLPICVFCNQLFDPDEEDGVAKRNSSRKEIGYTAFFDDRYPDRYAMADPALRKKYAPYTLVKQAATLLPKSARGHG